MSGRMIIRPIVAVAALYVLIAMAAALARFPGYAMSGDPIDVREPPAIATNAELYELRTEDIVP